MDDAIDRMAEEVGVERAWIEGALLAAHTSYKNIRIKKRSGGVRVLIQPSVETKMIQAWLQLRILSRLPVSVIATAFEPGSSIVSNAKMHRNSRYSVRVDLSDFFPSIRLQDLIEVIKSNRIAIPDWALEPQVQRLFAGACFDRNMRLPVGYPTSPRIANLVMKKIDEQLISTIKSDVSKYGNAVLSRYADDFVFSTDMRGACANFVSALKFSLATTPSPVLRVNEKKTKMMSREGGSTLITGLRVKQNGQVGIHANYRDHLRLLLKLFAADLLKTEERQQLRGHLAFIANADPSLYTKLSFKYFAEIAKLNELTAMPSPRASPPFKSAPSRSSRN